MGPRAEARRCDSRKSAEQRKRTRDEGRSLGADACPRSLANVHTAGKPKCRAMVAERWWPGQCRKDVVPVLGNDLHESCSHATHHILVVASARPLRRAFDGGPGSTRNALLV